MPDYRETVAKCPACGVMMEERGAHDVMVDVCPGCRGLWIDWYDGDTVEVALKAAPLSVRAPVPIVPEKALCPRCHRPMLGTTLVAHADAITESKHGLGAYVLRCGECAGTFVPRTAFDELLELSAHAGPEVEGAASAWAKLLAVVKKLLGTAPAP